MLSYLKLVLLLLVSPCLVGAIFTLPKKSFVKKDLADCSKLEKNIRLFLWSWIIGQLLLWCLFQIIAVFNIITTNMMDEIVVVFGVSMACVCVAGLCVIIITVCKRDNLSGNVEVLDVATKVLWIIVLAIIAIQMILGASLAYREVDDSFYVTEAVRATTADGLYVTIPTTGLTTEMDYRHSLEPFPIWIGFIAKLSGVHAATVAHVFMPLVFMPFTYGLYYLIGVKLVAKIGANSANDFGSGGKKNVMVTSSKLVPIYMLITEAIVMFGYYSTRTPEKFFVTRIRQGKTALCSFIIPAMILCLLLIVDSVQEKAKLDIRVWLMLFAIVTAGCLCSTLAAFLCPMFIGLVAVFMIFMYKSWKHLLPMIICCLPCLAIIFLYIVKG